MLDFPKTKLTFFVTDLQPVHKYACHCITTNTMTSTLTIKTRRSSLFRVYHDFNTSDFGFTTISTKSDRLK